MILVLGIAAGWLAGYARSQIRGTPYHVPELSQLWLVPLAVLPQLLVFQIPATSDLFSDRVAAIILVASQLVLLVFIWLNRGRTGILILGCGLLLNLLVITHNSGLMPISPETASSLYPEVPIAVWQVYTRPGWSKNILLSPENTRLAWLSDTILLPTWFPWTRALSPGDLLIVLGAFWLLTLESSRPAAPSLRKSEI